MSYEPLSKSALNLWVRRVWAMPVARENEREPIFRTPTPPRRGRSSSPGSPMGCDSFETCAQLPHFGSPGGRGSIIDALPLLKERSGMS
eukprot:9191171-Pyramimonas_sp.AAC.1